LLPPGREPRGRGSGAVSGKGTRRSPALRGHAAPRRCDGPRRKLRARDRKGAFGRAEGTERGAAGGRRGSRDRSQAAPRCRAGLCPKLQGLGRKVAFGRLEGPGGGAASGRPEAGRRAGASSLGPRGASALHRSEPPGPAGGPEGRLRAAGRDEGGTGSGRPERRGAWGQQGAGGAGRPIPLEARRLRPRSQEGGCEEERSSGVEPSRAGREAPQGVAWKARRPAGSDLRVEPGGWGEGERGALRGGIF
jgi:hypothetical protein